MDKRLPRIVRTVVDNGYYGAIENLSHESQKYHN